MSAEDVRARERELAEAVLALAAIVASTLENCGEPPRAVVRQLLREFLERWTDENPDQPPRVHEIVRRTIHEILDAS